MSTKERVNELLKMVSEEDLWITKNSLKCIHKYFDIEAKIALELKILKTRDYEPAIFVEEKECLEMRKYYNYRSAISSVKVLNRLCGLYEMDKIYKGDYENEEEIISFMEDITITFFRVEKVKTSQKSLSA